jgi:ectoine hydroxylase-related dioxygenase (phytanoyl-CoA dioxygenase family)
MASPGNTINDESVAGWRRDGITVVERFLTSRQLVEAKQHVQSLYKDDQQLLRAGTASERAASIGISDDQFLGLRFFPYADHHALNLVALDLRLVTAAKRALRTQHVLMYQSLVHVKKAGIANYEQPFHLDYPLHTLLAPSERPTHKTIICTVFLTDVDGDSGPFAFVPRRYTHHLDATRTVLSPEETLDLSRFECRLVVPAGTLVMYSPDDLYHRGTNLAGATAYRWSVTSSFRAATCHFMGGLTWPTQGLDESWPWVFGYATSEQLAALGVPLPGDPYWTPKTIRAVQFRYPQWNPEEWLEHVQPESIASG